MSDCVLGELFLRHVENGEKGNLHTLHHSNKGHEQEENNDRDSRRDAFPHGSLSSKQRSKSNSKGISENCEGQQDAGPEKQILHGVSGWLIRVNWLSGELGEEDLDKVHRVQETGEFNAK